MHAVPNRKYRIGRSKTGLGLYAIKPFRKREYIVTYRGRRIRNAEADKLEARGSRYMFEINSRWTIDGSKRWNVARYVNHSCRPNAEAIERRGPIIVYCARRKIKPDEEITVNPSLTEKLRRDLGTEIPLDWVWEDKPIGVELDEIEAGVAGTGWSVRRDAVIGLFCFGIILEPIAISKAMKAKKMMEANPNLTGSGKANAALAIAIIGLVLWVVGIAARVGSH